MSFLAPVLLFGLPLALLPVIIHLIHLLRRRQVPWAAMMFLRKAQKMNKGLSKLRQYLILAARVLAVLAIIFVISRPLAGGLLGLTGGAPDTVIVLLDRSASMEEQLLATGTSKREAALQNLTAAIKQAYGKHSKLVLIDSATREPVLLENADALADVPQSSPTDTAADIPALLQAGLDYLTNNQAGRTDVWLVSDLRETDWDAAGGRWAALRSAFSTLKGIRFQVLAYPEVQEQGLGVMVENVQRRASLTQSELLLDIRLQALSPPVQEETIPVRVTVNGVTSTIPVVRKGPQVLLQAQSIPIDQETKRGMGRVELPADGSPSDNIYHFTFDEPAPLKSVVVSDDEDVFQPILAALQAPADPLRVYTAEAIPESRAAEIAWEETGLIVWQASLPEADSPLAKQLDAHLTAGRSLLFLPPHTPTETSFRGNQWTSWQSSDEPALAEWWRADDGLLANTRDKKALPVGEIAFQRWCTLQGRALPMARLDESQGRAPLLLQNPRDDAEGGCYFLTTWPGPGSSSLARDGVVLFALLHRALNEGAATLGRAQQRTASAKALGDQVDAWRSIDESHPTLSLDRPLRAGVVSHASTDVQVALNRPAGEDDPRTLNAAVLEELFTGLDWRLLERTLENEKSLTSEVWRTFLLLMAAALIIEALLCMPARRREEPVTA